MLSENRDSSFYLDYKWTDIYYFYIFILPTCNHCECEAFPFASLLLLYSNELRCVKALRSFRAKGEKHIIQCLYNIDPNTERLEPNFPLHFLCFLMGCRCPSPRRWRKAGIFLFSLLRECERLEGKSKRNEKIVGKTKRKKMNEK